jgi:hypothetical protein
VTDARALPGAARTATASLSDLATGGGTGKPDIRATVYSPGSVTMAGAVNVASTRITLSGPSQAIVSGTARSGANSVSWHPAITVSCGARFSAYSFAARNSFGSEIFISETNFLTLK